MEPSSHLTHGNRAAIRAVTHRFNAGCGLVGQEPDKERPIERWPVGQMERHCALAEGRLMRVAPTMGRWLPIGVLKRGVEAANACEAGGKRNLSDGHRCLI